MSVIALLSLLALSFANPVPQVVSDDASVITEVNSAVRQFLQTSRPRDQADADGQAHFFAEQTARLETTATFKQRTDNSHGWDCSPWRTNPLPSFVWCMEAGNDLGYMPWPKGTVFGQKDPITKACAPGVVACMPMVFGEGDCQMVLDFYPEEEKTDTAWIGNINDVVLWEMLKCQAWRWESDPWKTGGTISAGDHNRLKLSIEYRQPTADPTQPEVVQGPFQPA